MTSRDFVYWLQGYFEVRDASKPGPETLSPEQVAIIKAHLAMVFKHEIDPALGTPEHMAILQKIHDVLPPQKAEQLSRALEEIEELGRKVADIEKLPRAVDPHQRFTC
jgi:predicted DNA-binding transcriptional regulator YafY